MKDTTKIKNEIKKYVTINSGKAISSTINRAIEDGMGLKDMMDIFLKLEYESERGIGKWANTT